MMRKINGDFLRRIGFSQAEIDRLTELRKAFHEQQAWQALIIQRRLEFMRWLVLNGRLTERHG
jgi:hypothetical protein